MSNECCLTWFKWVNSIFLVTLIIQTARIKKEALKTKTGESIHTNDTIGGLSRTWLRRRKSYRLWTHVSLFIRKPLQDPSSIFRIQVYIYRDRFLRYQTEFFKKALDGNLWKPFHLKRKNKIRESSCKCTEPKGSGAWYQKSIAAQMRTQPWLWMTILSSPADGFWEVKKRQRQSRMAFRNEDKSPWSSTK